MKEISEKLSKNEKAFTLIELLIVILIVAVLLALSIPAWKKAMEWSKANACMANLRILYTALNAYAEDHGNCYPMGYNKTTGTWLGKVDDYLPKGSFKISKSVNLGVTFCPSTLDGQYPRNPKDWDTDYNINGLVATAKESDNNRSVLRGSLCLLFDGIGAAPDYTKGDTKEVARHMGMLNVIFVDGHIEMMSTLKSKPNLWKASN